MKLPAKLQSRLWSKPVQSIDLNQDSAYVIRQLLLYGTADDLRWLLKQYPLAQIEDVFAKTPKTAMHPSIERFVTVFLNSLHHAAHS